MQEMLDFLACATPQSWIEAALKQQQVLLIDHKNCEWKAAATAFHLMGKHATKLDLVNKMSRLAREELVHMEQVLRILKKRNIALVSVSASRYASSLRELVRAQEPYRLTDTLVIGAFIECRSCERFAALAPHLDEELGTFYGGLLKSESRHFQDYLKLAYTYGERADVDAAVDRVRALEAELVSSPDREFRFHSGCPV
ncbi:tRNA-(ms[2]io[6]A)-hydroxylase [Azotobacter bryophylli]|uniref:tRNA-(Ms[2]io[6]A)-hydroxylase n=1 Tax=Azotobacter bryophylli TaxID=1986537 RepID=A0ABV7AS52_9GAMM